ncbi:MAG: putative aspartyl protease [Planctomycetota bacterium]|jgi:predicted aspartyl protease
MKLGMPTSYRWIFAKEGYFRRDMRGTFPESVGYDGAATWKVEGRSPPYPLVFLEEERLKTLVWVWSSAWIIEDSPFEIHFADDHSTAETRLRLKLKEGLLQGILALDAKTHLPRRLEFDDAFGAGTVYFSDWRDVAGVPMPWLVKVEEADGRKTSYTSQDTHEYKGTPPPFSQRGGKGKDTDFIDGVAEEIKVRRSKRGHYFVRPLIDGQDLGWFLFDSGLGGSIITKNTADKLKLGTFGKTTLSGFGPGPPTKTHFRQTHAVQLGPLLIDGLVMIETENMGMADRMLAGEVCAGALGWDVFLRATVEMDSKNDRVLIHDPETFQAPKAAWQDLYLHWQVPYLSARFADDRQGYFCLDTGAGEMNALFHYSAAKHLGLLDLLALEAKQLTGASGQFDVQRVELDWFEIAGNRQNPVEVMLSTAEDGESDPYSYGFVGSGLLGDVIVVFDYMKSRVGFVQRN